MTARRVDTDALRHASSDRAARTRRAAHAASAAVLLAETIGSILMWGPLPLAWIWIGARVYDATDSLLASGAVALLGLALTVSLTVTALTRVDRLWVVLRRRAGHNQAQGALTEVVVVSATFALVTFLVWYYLLSKAFILPFMPSR